MIVKRVISCGFLLVFIPVSFFAGQEQPDASGSKARAVLEAVTQQLGGERFLNIRTVRGKGLYTRFGEDGQVAFMAEFVDVIVYPDKERTEFGKGKKRLIQTNDGSSGWIYDGPKGVIRDQTPEEIENFKRGLGRNLDSLLRRWRQPGVQLRYLKEKEIWFRQRGHGVEIRLPLKDGQQEVVKLYVDPLTKEPVKVAYGSEEDRFFLFRDFAGVKIPTRIDHYKNGVQTARIAYGSIEFDRPVKPTLFAKPESPKKVK